MSAICVSNLGKAYKRYSNKWARLAEWITGRVRHQEHWVLRNISFSIEPGEAVGIIGINGAGKSTLLKMITGTTQPTTGSVQVTGRVSALLELGMGFHPDFTGRQNAFMTGQLLGYGVEEIASLMPEIEAFAEIGDYIDQPVRVYSSGMQVRLAFSVATAIRPDILIVDEALAVGDVFFQQKCFDRIRAFRDKGTTLLFVSHAMSTVYALCDKAILLERGCLERMGSPKEIIDLYNARLAVSTSAAESRASIEEDISPAMVGHGGGVGSYSSAGVAIESVQLLCHGEQATAVVSGSLLVLRVCVGFHKAYDDPHVGFQLKNSRGEPLYMTTTAGLNQKIGRVKVGDRIEVDFHFQVALAEGDYTFTVGVADGAIFDGTFRDSLARIQDAAAVTIVRDVAAGRWAGMFNLAPTCVVRNRPGAHVNTILATTSRSFMSIDLATKERRVIHEGDGLYYGIAVTPDRIFVAARRRMVSSAEPPESEAGVIHVFNRALKYVETLVPPFPLRDLHGIAFHNGVLWVVCSYDDMVARWDGCDWTQWYPLGMPADGTHDVFHFNSLYFEDDALWLLAHKRGPSELLKFSIGDLRLLERVSLGIQAHDIWREDGRLCTCSSGDGYIVSEGGTELHTGKFPRGYLRVRENRLVGLSERAERHERDFTSCSIRCYDENWNSEGEIILDGEGLILALAQLDE